ncbi:dimethylarginine dimethylaminohydrolase family protein [Aeropyrum camini]|nr:arginine deiminase family protein [Aeropyrum camini]
MGGRIFDTVLTRRPPHSMSRCITEPGYRGAAKFSYEEAQAQYRGYVESLRSAGITVNELEPLEDYPDSVFIQDTAVVGGRSGVAVLARFGASPRRGEENHVAPILSARGFEIIRVRPPGTLEGGDVLVTGEGVVFAGLSSRTSMDGVETLRKAFPGVNIETVRVKGLHLLSYLGYLGGSAIASAEGLYDRSIFRRHGFDVIEIPWEEREAANLLNLGGGKVLLPAGYNQTRDLLEQHGFKVVELGIRQFQACMGGVTCLSLPIYKIL